MIHGVLLLLGCLYATFIVDPQIFDPAHVGSGQFLFDSSQYLAAAKSVPILKILEPTRGPSSSIPTIGTNALILLEGKLAWLLLPSSPDIVVFLTNYLVLVAALRNAAKLAVAVGLRMTPAIHLLILLNPFILLNLVSLTKDIWGVFFITAMALFAQRRQWPHLGITTVFSVFARFYYLAVGFAFAIVSRVGRWSVAYLFLAVSFLYGCSRLLFGDVTGFALIKSSDLGQRSAHLMHLMGQIQGYPFGDLVAAPVILLVNVSAWLNTRQYAVPWNAWYVWANTVSTFVFCAFAAWGAYRYLRLPERRASVAVLGRFIGAFLILDTLYPVSQHRYLLPIYPMLVLWAAGDRDRDSGRAVVSGSAAS